MTEKLEVIKKEIEKEVQEQFKKLNEKETIDLCPECNMYCKERFIDGICK